MTEIDELEGRVLALAVMFARGGIPQAEIIKNHQFLLDGQRVFVTLNEDVWAFDDTKDGAPGRPDLNIAQAWELDGEGWVWMFQEVCHYRYGDDDPPDRYELWVFVSRPDHMGHFEAEVTLTDFPTKARAYALARCRAYLKAMA